MEDQHSTDKKTVTSKVSPWLARLLYPFGCYILLPLFFGHLKVTGQENIPRSGPVIVAPTHRSRWDALVVPYAVGRLASGRDLHYMVSVNEIKGIQGWFIRRMGGFPVDPEHPAISSFRHSVELLSEDKMLVIFPEGALSHGGVYRDEWIHPLRRGVATVAIEAESRRPGCGTKILPVSIKYSEQYPSWGANVNVEIGEPLSVTNYMDSSPRKGSQQLTADLEASLKKLYEPSESLPLSAAQGS